jgi:hypothetical protein
MKLLLTFGPPSAYDRLAALRDSGDVDIEELQQGSRREVAQAKEELLVLAEKERLERQKEAILARRRAALAEASVALAPNVVMAEPAAAPRAIFDTGPIVDLARSAVRSVRRRPPERVPEAV